MKDYQFYHIYPLGMLDQLNEGSKEGKQLNYIENFIPHLLDMNVNGVYIGPVFKSEYHGYDTIDYRIIDPRLGTNEMFRSFVHKCHSNEIDVIVDCVFNHVSRQFFAFQDVLIKKEHSVYADWFKLNFHENNSRNDGFSYDTWDGHDILVKLNLQNLEVRNYLIDTAKFWFDQFSIDGLRLDAYDVMDREFVRVLKEEMQRYTRKEFFVVGEMVHGDYSKGIKEGGIDSITNYEGYKGLYSSLNDSNYYEIGYSLKRLFGNGSCKGLIQDNHLYNFVDNHDVNRVASVLKEECHLYPLYLMLYTIPGYPSLYYKSEFGEKGIRSHSSDHELRKPFRIEELYKEHPLYQSICKLSKIRKNTEALKNGNYEEVFVDHQLIIYKRSIGTEKTFILINSSDAVVNLERQHITKLEKSDIATEVYDLLNDEKINVRGEIQIHPNWGRILAS